MGKDIRYKIHKIYQNIDKDKCEHVYVYDIHIGDILWYICKEYMHMSQWSMHAKLLQYRPNYNAYLPLPWEDTKRREELIDFIYNLLPNETRETS